MPEISIGSCRANEYYGLKAEEVFWVKQGILSIQNLRDSDDEEMIADFAISILNDSPFARSKESLDEIYDISSEKYKNIEIRLAQYSTEKLTDDIKNTFSILKNLIESEAKEDNYLRKLVNPSSKTNSIKNTFYAIFMAFYELIVRRGLSPAEPHSILSSLKGLQKYITTSTHYTTSEGRKKNIDITIGLIQNYFVKKEPAALTHGAGLALDFENSLRRSKIETPRYEFKQGFLRLDSERKYDNDLENQILRTICGMANLGPCFESYIYIGVADKKDDADRISHLDKIVPYEISNHYVVGIDREAKLLNISVEEYCRKITQFIANSSLSVSLTNSILSCIDIINYRTFSIIRIHIPKQKSISYFDNKVYIRQHSSTMHITEAVEIIRISDSFK